ncbi:MAG: hypothetical protein R3247_12040 [Rhodothermales bacterium]|nr:hypothetical protein [Rhodothermales bacterium]
MFAHMRLRLKHKTYLRNEHGIKKFAEMSMGQLIRRATKKSAFYREMNENLLVEKANLRMRRDELYEQPRLEAGGFFTVRRRLWSNNLLVVLIIIAAIFLNVLSVETFINETSGVGSVMRWIAASLLAIVLTGGGMVIAERLIGSVIPRKHVPTEPSGRRSALAVLWGVLLVGFEASILGLADVQAASLAGAAENSLLYVGYVVASMTFPLVAGAFRWDALRYVDRYKTTLVLRQIESRLAQIDSILRQNDEFESNFYKIKSLEYWDQVNDFKAIKDNYNQKKGIVEQVGGHFAQNYDQFMAEANKRYTQDIRDVTTKSLRKLELVDAPKTSRTGTKLGQTPDGQEAERATRTNGAEAATGSKIDYMSLKPVR